MKAVRYISQRENESEAGGMGGERIKKRAEIMVYMKITKGQFTV